ncbi:putative late blight resistance protein homolog R1B-17 isoform X2 [Salvia miltiorrhiza]|uniref:putative late blight resistance protein homolog R1B-17 isoform X2 n=1 Tax=Salvia miltiorrhiza TaxID=226208 RepID=UPI0025ACF6E7|nr:putative late blight resistance protein homolog R1B-17 isoform X2 [Salvia miltiorrhiza]
MHIIDNLQLHPRPPISLHTKQVESLTQKVTFLQEFLEGYNPHLGYSTEADSLESRIADAAYAAEDVIESHIVDQITNGAEKISSDGLYEALEKVIQDMALIEKEAMGVEHQLHRNSTPSDSQRSSSNALNSSMVGVEDVKLQMMDMLTSNSQDLLIIPIVGMGGTGKTTLARNIYQERLTTEHFDICAWATISQEYSVREIYAEVLGVDHNLSELELGEKLHKHLYGRRYLIVMDDMWSIDAWDRVRNHFPDIKNGSRIVVTTRLSNLAYNLPGSDNLEMGLLSEANSWDLLSKTVFGEEGCPLELEEIGKKIGKSCKGLPLSITVVGGLLAKSEHTREFWEYIEENLNAIVNLEDNERCLKILHLSYKQLPVYLKPCFLYMGIFPEDVVIAAARVVRLWVDEGFLKPVSGKSSEEIGKGYLKDLVQRNLILVHEIGSIGSIKKCKMHDLLRDFCLREAQKERFYTVVGRSPIPNTRRSIVIPSTSMEEASHALHSMPQARSLIWGLKEKPPSLSLRLLRIFESTNSCPYQETMLQLVNLRRVAGISIREESLVSSIHRFWNLETLIIEGDGSKYALPAEVWCMPQIRHIHFKNVHLLDPDTSRVDDADIILRNLLSLKNITNFRCSDDVVKRIPNIKKLGINYTEVDERLHTDNLVCLEKLESLKCRFPTLKRDSLESINFPHSLKKLKLRLWYSPFWQDILEKIGSLPHLEKLKLDSGRFEGRKWETVEGQFRSLKFLEISRSNLVEWTMESSHFPRLEQLVLRRLQNLYEIPLDIAEIPTLGLIYFVFGHTHALYSLKRIVELQDELYGKVDLQVLLRLKGYAFETDAELECRKSPYIRLEYGTHVQF